MAGKPTMDWCSPRGAAELAEKLTMFWRARGFVVATRAVALAFPSSWEGDRSSIYAVESDLVGGLPRPGSEVR